MIHEKLIYQEKKSFVSKFFTVIMASLTFLDGYSLFFLKSISIAYWGLIICVLLFFIQHSKKKLKIIRAPIFLFGCLFLLTLFSIMIVSKYNLSNMIINICKYGIWAIVLGIVNPNIFDKEKCKKIMITIAIIATTYLFLQYISYYSLRIKLPNTYNLLLIQGRRSSDFEEVITSSRYRPGSIFSEPAFYSNYVLCTLTSLLFNRKKKKHIFLIAFFSVGIIFSTSTAGIYMLPVLLAIYYYSINKKNAIKIIVIILMALLILILIINVIYPYLNDLGYIGQTLKRALDKPQGYETSSRIGLSYEYLDDLDKTTSIIGAGIGNEYACFNRESFYLNSITRIIIQSGYIGLSCFILFALWVLLKHRNPISSYLLILYVVKCFTGNAMFSVGGIMFLSMALSQEMKNAPQTILKDENMLNQTHLWS